MKYIRTKDGIYQITDPNRKTNITVCTNHGWVFKEDIIKQADSIEELCDEFVYIRHDKPHYPPKVVKDLGALRENRWCDVFGAIWTGKGLIYVAKLNDEGELELL